MLYIVMCRLLTSAACPFPSSSVRDGRRSGTPKPGRFSTSGRGAPRHQVPSGSAFPASAMSSSFRTSARRVRRPRLAIIQNPGYTSPRRRSVPHRSGGAWIETMRLSPHMRGCFPICGYLTALNAVSSPRMRGCYGSPSAPALGFYVSACPSCSFLLVLSGAVECQKEKGGLMVPPLLSDP